MNREQHRRERRADDGRALLVPRKHVGQQPQREEVKQNRIRRVQDKIGEMVAERVHAPYNVIEPQRHPGERLVMPHKERREHPAEISPAEAAEIGVFEVEGIVVVIDDDTLYLKNPYFRGLGWGNLRWMFTTFLMGHYQPLTWVTLGLDYVIWGMRSEEHT